MMQPAHKLFAIIFTALTLATSVDAAALERAKGKIILTLSGAIGDESTATVAAFDLAMLARLPQKSFVTHTPWAKQPIKFTGPLLRDVLAAVKAKPTATNIVVTAGNDYKIPIPVSDALQFDVIVAHKMDDRPIPDRTKGPLFIIYPFDAKAELQTEIYHNRAAWQVKSIKVE
jgi:hypothetical protein